MPDLIAASLAVDFGTTTLFDDVSLTIDRGDRIALVGPNGAGKTTLLRVLAGRLKPTSGELRVPEHLHVALHDQRPERTGELLRSYAAPPHMVELEQQLRQLEHAMATGDPEVMRSYERVRARYDAAGGEGWLVRVETVLRGLGFTAEQCEQPLDTLSGGELTRASLARTLAGNPDVLLLDEPTNHLDMESIDWLQDYLQDVPGGLVMVSHDRWFIETTCTSVVEIVGGKARHFRGSFVEYRAQQALEAVSQQRSLERMKTEVVRLQRFVDRFQAGTRSRQATSRVKALERLKTQAPEYADLRARRVMDFRLPRPPRSGAVVFDVRGIELGFESNGAPRTLLPPTDFVVERGEKVALLGRNGTGKSTLLHSLAAACVPLLKPPSGFHRGDIRVGYDVAARLLSQHDSELLDTATLLGNMNHAAPAISKREALSLLGLFGFRGADADRRLVSTLSGGERRRLLMAMALTGSSNVLLLDEPTNHLDLESREGLESALAEFEGTVLLISHDRALVEGVATRTVVLHDQTLTTVVGGYTQARAVLLGEADLPVSAIGAAGGNGHGTAPATPSGKGRRDRAASAGAAPGSPATGDVVGQRRTVRAGPATGSAGRSRGKRDPKGAPRVRRPATIEREIEQLERELNEVQQLMLDPGVYTSPERSADALERHSRLEREVATRYQELEAAIEHHGG